MPAGELPTHYCAVFEGECGMYADDLVTGASELINVAERGQSCGDMALLRGEPLQGSVRTHVDSVMMVMAVRFYRSKSPRALPLSDACTHCSSTQPHRSTHSLIPRRRTG